MLPFWVGEMVDRVTSASLLEVKSESCGQLQVEPKLMSSIVTVKSDGKEVRRKAEGRTLEN